jgi:hypothetical protein
VIDRWLRSIQALRKNFRQTGETMKAPRPSTRVKYLPQFLPIGHLLEWTGGTLPARKTHSFAQNPKGQPGATDRDKGSDRPLPRSN